MSKRNEWNERFDGVFKEGLGRERFLIWDEETALISITESRFPYLTSSIKIAVNTKLRKSELLKLATKLRESNVHEFEIAELLGHSSIKITRRHAHGQAHKMQQAVNSIVLTMNHKGDELSHNNNVTKTAENFRSRETAFASPFHHFKRNGSKGKTPTMG